MCCQPPVFVRMPPAPSGWQRSLISNFMTSANENPFFHHGLFTTLRQSVLVHSGEAKTSRLAFQALPTSERDAVIEFLKSLQVLPPGTKDLVVDETYHGRSWPTATIAVSQRR